MATYTLKNGCISPRLGGNKVRSLEFWMGQDLSGNYDMVLAAEAHCMPWHGFIIFYIVMAMAVYLLHEFTPFAIIIHNDLAVIAALLMLLLIFTGLNRFIPLFRTPLEPAVSLEDMNKQIFMTNKFA
jgi:Na+/H+ antiporter NhaC